MPSCLIELWSSFKCLRTCSLFCLPTHRCATQQFIDTVGTVHSIDQRYICTSDIQNTSVAVTFTQDTPAIHLLPCSYFMPHPVPSSLQAGHACKQQPSSCTQDVQLSHLLWPGSRLCAGLMAAAAGSATHCFSDCGLLLLRRRLLLLLGAGAALCLGYISPAGYLTYGRSAEPLPRSGHSSPTAPPAHTAAAASTGAQHSS